MIFPLQYITQNHPELSHSKQAIKMYEAGCKWVQLRMKNQSKEHILEEAKKILPYALKHKAILTLNDHLDLAIESKAHGIHLGKNDTDLQKAKRLLKNDELLGATANTITDIKEAVKKQASYIGLGPLRFTSTKTDLSPVLGFEGYKKIMEQLSTLKITVSIYAIGGITLQDLEPLKQIGVNGVAVSSLLLNSTQKEKDIARIHRIFAT